jgi:hypothetical protein
MNDFKMCHFLNKVHAEVNVERGRWLQAPATKPISRRWNRSARQHLLPELGEGVAQRSTGDLHQPSERAVQLFDQKDRAGDRQRADEQGR